MIGLGEEGLIQTLSLSELVDKQLVQSFFEEKPNKEFPNSIL